MRYCGKIGFGTTQEVEPGIFEDVITERRYKGDVIWAKRQVSQTDGMFPEVVVNNAISVIMDSMLDKSLYDIRYVEWRGKRWTIKSLEIQPPRVTLYIGSIYNGETPEASSEA